jgi:Ser/Thr protein kinase RdoA (MazF antagonist)
MYWRLTGFLPGRPPQKDSLEEAGSSARAMGLCHVALNVPKPIELINPIDSSLLTNQMRCQPDDFTNLFKYYRGHPNLESLTDPIRRGEKAAQELPTRPSFIRAFAARDLVIHKDCKADNFLFDSGSISIIDWDTVGYGDPLLDLGEMCRSWAVSQAAPYFKADFALAIVNGYRQSGLALRSEDYQLLPAVIRGLTINLARRYLTDALAETYFKWDQKAYPSLYEQNKSRGERMLDLAEELLERDMELVNLLSSII